MAMIEVAALSHKLDEEESAAVHSALAEAEVRVDLDEEADPRVLTRDVDDDLFADFLDQLDANDAACDIYVPGDFEEVFDVSGYRIGSSHTLSMVLDDIKDDIFHGEEDDDDDEDDADYDDYDDDDGPAAHYDDDGPDNMQFKDEHMRHLWRVMYKGARTSIDERLCLFVSR